MDKVQKHNSFNTNTPSSESYRNDLDLSFIDHSPPSSAEVKECVELYLHSPNTPSWRGAELKKAQGLFYLTFKYYIGPTRAKFDRTL
jgi:hypothetical protein